MVDTYRHFGGNYLSNYMTSHSIYIIFFIYSIYYIIILPRIFVKDCTLTRPSRPVVMDVFKIHTHINSLSRHVLENDGATIVAVEEK